MLAGFILAVVNPNSAQYETHEPGAEEAVKTPTIKLEDTVVTDMLRIVDNKFDTLTTRITALERAVSNLQFFSIRQFRAVGGDLQEVKKGVESLSDQVGKLEVDSRGLKINSHLLHREVSTLKGVASTLAEDLASGIKEVSGNLGKQDQFLQALVQDTALTLTQNLKKDFQDSLNEMMLNSEAKEKTPINCTVEFAPVTDHIDQRITRLKRDVYTGVSNLLKAHRSVTTEKCDEILNRYQTETCRQREIVAVQPEQDKTTDMTEKQMSPIASLNETKKAKLELKEAKQSTTADVPPRGIGEIIKETHQRPSEKSGQSVAESKRNVTQMHSMQNENDAMIMEALTNMTTSVQQAVSYFKNTAYILEVILSNTDMLLNAKKTPEPKPVPLPFQDQKQFGLGRESFFGDFSGVEAISAFPGPRSRELQRPVDDTAAGLSQRDGGRGCSVPDHVIRNIDGLVKNGSQLLELLTDLAQMSAMSLTTATQNLQAQISTIENIQSNMNAAFLAQAKVGTDSDTRSELVKLSNTTVKILKLVETVSSNSGWLPLIFHNVKHQDAVGNRTLHIVSQNHGLLRRLVHSARQRFTKPDETNQSGVRESNEEFSLDQESLEIIYITSLQLHRIMPALTKLLAEPYPLITLVNGGRPDQGRVEIYHKGRWGAFCHRNISHDEADVICRHLGFKGGISAGAGHFGAGAGVSWSVNVTCLETAQCTSVSLEKTASPCSHDMDAAVICDHMLRIIASDASSDNKTGRLEIHHRGLWQPICSEGWAGRSARVACQQMGYSDGRTTEIDQWDQQTNTTWLTRVSCRGNEYRLDSCMSGGWRFCKDQKPVGVRCV